MKDIDLLDYGFTNLDILAYEHTVFLKIKKTLEDIKKNKKIKSENLRTKLEDIQKNLPKIAQFLDCNDKDKGKNGFLHKDVFLNIEQMLDISDQSICAILPYLVTGYLYSFSKSKLIKGRRKDSDKSTDTYKLIFETEKIESDLCHNYAGGIKSLTGNFFIIPALKFPDFNFPNKPTSETSSMKKPGANEYLNYKLDLIFGLCTYYLQDIYGVNLSLSKFALELDKALMTCGNDWEDIDRKRDELSQDDISCFLAKDDYRQLVMDAAQNELQYPRLEKINEIIRFEKEESTIAKESKHHQKEGDSIIQPETEPCLTWQTYYDLREKIEFHYDCKQDTQKILIVFYVSR